jgi:hypothetical protein
VTSPETDASIPWDRKIFLHLRAIGGGSSSSRQLGSQRRLRRAMRQ